MAVTGIDPVTNMPFTPQQLRLVRLALLATIIPWYSITEPLPNCPQALEYSKIVGTRTVIYIYRLKSDHSIVYIGSAEKGYQRFVAHGANYRSFLKTYGTYVNRKPVYTGGCIDFYSAVKLHGWAAFEISLLTYASVQGLMDTENKWLALKPTLNRTYLRMAELKCHRHLSI